MITGKELWIDGLNEGIITNYEEYVKGDDTIIFVIGTIRKNNDTYETDIKCMYTIENYVSVKQTDKKVIVKTYITRWEHENWRL